LDLTKAYRILALPNFALSAQWGTSRLEQKCGPRPRGSWGARGAPAGHDPRALTPRIRTRRTSVTSRTAHPLTTSPPQSARLYLAAIPRVPESGGVLEGSGGRSPRPGPEGARGEARREPCSLPSTETEQMRGKVGAISMSFVLHRTRWIDVADREALSSLAVTTHARLSTRAASEEPCAPRQHCRGGDQSTADRRRHVVRGGRRWPTRAGHSRQQQDAPISHFFSACRYTGPRMRVRRLSFTS